MYDDTLRPKASSSPQAALLLVSLVVLGVALACGGTFEPTPDIPEHVEYDTVRIDYGAGDGLEPMSEGTRTQELVGEASPLAGLTRETVAFTNNLLADQFKLINDIKANPVTEYTDGRWIWETREVRKDYARFEIVEIKSPTSQEKIVGAYAYLLYIGKSKNDNALVYSAEFYQFDQARQLSNAQQGYGVVRFFFNALRRYDPSAPLGNIRIAFRARNNVRQVRVNFNGIRQRLGDERLRALYQYTQLPDNQGRMTYFGFGDYSNDGEPYEFLAAQAAWTSNQEGHVAASVSGGSLDESLPNNRLILRECWDMAGITRFARSQPSIPDYEGGQLEDCAIALQTVELSPPQYQATEDVDPELPPAHPQE